MLKKDVFLVVSFGTLVLLFRHLRLIFVIYPGKKLRLKYGQTGWCLQYSRYSSFRRHLVKMHAHDDKSDDDAHQQYNSVLKWCNTLSTYILLYQTFFFFCSFPYNIQSQVLNLLPADSTSRKAIEKLLKSIDNPFSWLNSDKKNEKNIYISGINGVLYSQVKYTLEWPLNYTRFELVFILVNVCVACAARLWSVTAPLPPTWGVQVSRGSCSRVTGKMEREMDRWSGASVVKQALYRYCEEYRFTECLNPLH